MRHQLPRHSRKRTRRMRKLVRGFKERLSLMALKLMMRTFQWAMTSLMRMEERRMSRMTE